MNIFALERKFRSLDYRQFEIEQKYKKLNDPKNVLQQPAITCSPKGRNAQSRGHPNTKRFYANRAIKTSHSSKNGPKAGWDPSQTFGDWEQNRIIVTTANRQTNRNSRHRFSDCEALYWRYTKKYAVGRFLSSKGHNCFREIGCCEKPFCSQESLARYAGKGYSRKKCKRNISGADATHYHK